MLPRPGYQWQNDTKNVSCHPGGKCDILLTWYGEPPRVMCVFCVFPRKHQKKDLNLGGKYQTWCIFMVLFVMLKWFPQSSTCNLFRLVSYFPCDSPVLDPKEGCEVPSPLVALLLTHGANVNRCDARGKTPLMHVRDAKMLDGFLCWQHVLKKGQIYRELLKYLTWTCFNTHVDKKPRRSSRKRMEYSKYPQILRCKTKSLPGMVQFYTKYSRKGLCKAGETWQTGESDGPLLLKPFFGWCKSTPVETQLNMKP